ncbi:DoxX family protein [Hazenella sp. IB182357]|uniref:DoxX family protein n=1 Tax=Polycladospora coralii TaxID=2771432 RepID=A0A926N542_9BACL|nr:DoxX family protein [Polycladospora coralii]MBD1371434.1 DoxX family protein [Polycladospora coralii]MBS7530402.1 DoxX family protein [Polycladospora coralii]
MNKMKKGLKLLGLVLFSFFFFLAGVFHFIEVQGFANMIPDFIPFRVELVYMTGIIEFILAVFLLIPKTRETTGMITAIYLILIFPANIYAAVKGIPAPGQEEANQTLLWVRLLFQPLMIWWVWAVSKSEQKDRTV